MLRQSQPMHRSWPQNYYTNFSMLPLVRYLSIKCRTKADERTALTCRPFYDPLKIRFLFWYNLLPRAPYRFCQTTYSCSRNAPSKLPMSPPTTRNLVYEPSQKKFCSPLSTAPSTWRLYIFFKRFFCCQVKKRTLLVYYYGAKRRRRHSWNVKE